MLFSSMIFLWIFLPLVLIVNYLIGLVCRLLNIDSYRYKNVFLLLASLFFYAWGGIYYLLLMLLVILINYLAGLCICRFAEEKRIVLVITIIINVMIIGYFKYFNLLISTIEYITGRNRGGLGIREVILPIGISFFIFQAMSYVIDLYLGQITVQRNLISFALYVALFPQLIAGPIVQYKDIAAELTEREESATKFANGIRRFIFGLSKKVLIANMCGDVTDRIWNMNLETLPATIAWFGMISYTLQIYFDFSGYSDMAIGLGRMLGFDFRENFDMPYTSLSIREFWRRWHISLSSWFRDYVYIPLGGSRVENSKVYRNLFIVFLLTGIWHGANYTFFFWGMYYAFFVIIERAFWGKVLDRCKFKPLCYVYTIMVVMVGWVFFRAESIRDAFGYLISLFRFVTTEESLLDLLNFKVLFAFIVGVFFAGPAWRYIKEKTAFMKDEDSISIPSYILQLCMLAVCILLLVSGSYNPFIYYQF